MTASIQDYLTLAGALLILAGFVASELIRRRQYRRMRESWRAELRAKYQAGRR